MVSRIPIHTSPLRLSNLISLHLVHIGTKPALALAPVVFGSKTYTADSGSQYMVNGQTLSPGGHITMSGTLISLASEPSSAGKEANSEPRLSRLVLPSLTIGSEIYTANQNSAYIVNDQALTPGAQITVDGTPVSLAPEASDLMVGGKAEALRPSFALPTITVGSKVYTADHDSAYIVNDQISTLGAQITVDGTPMSLAPQASSLVVGGKSSEPFVPSFTLPIITAGSKVYTANRDFAYIINGQTLTPGGQISVYGTAISLATQASALDVGSKVLPLAFALPTLTINSKLYAANPTAAYVISGQTLTPGGQISVDGTRISLDPEASALVIKSTTKSLQGSFALPPITINSKMYIANSTPKYIIEGQTLIPGAHITVEGTPISMAVDPSVLVIGSSTQNLVAVPTSTGLGQLIIEAFNNRVNGNDGSNAGNGDNASSAPTAGNGVAGSSRVIGVSVTNVTSMMGTPATNPTQTTAVIARGVSRKWNRKKIGFGAALSTIFVALV